MGQRKLNLLRAYVQSCVNLIAEAKDARASERHMLIAYSNVLKMIDDLRNSQRDKVRNTRREWVAKGLCGWCGQPSTGSTKLCEKHRALSKEYRLNQKVKRILGT
jgi:hypothetical protein